MAIPFDDALYECASCGQRWPVVTQCCACEHPRSRCCHAPLAITYSSPHTVDQSAAVVVLVTLAAIVALWQVGIWLPLALRG